ncbi:MAG TPA: hypothetical protein PKE47_06270 [Verrucomicrobiota bacterium]|nr:hypothetical protein [Verrucomicrobiota bacterium]
MAADRQPQQDPAARRRNLRLALLLAAAAVAVYVTFFALKLAEA